MTPSTVLLTGCSSGIGLLGAVTLARAGHVDVLVNNAGFGLGGSVYDLSMDELRAQFDTNFFGAVALTKAVLPGMIARRRGRIVQVSSASALHATPGLGAYCASKAAIEGITEALRHELAPFGVHVTSLLPGMYRTEAFQKRRLARSALDASSPFHELSRRALERLDWLVEHNAGDPQEVADALVRVIAAPNPPARVLVGRDARLQTTLRALVPARVWEPLVRRVVGYDGRLVKKSG